MELAFSCPPLPADAQPYSDWVERVIVKESLDCRMTDEHEVRAFSRRTGLPYSQIVVVQLPSGRRYPQWINAIGV